MNSMSRCRLSLARHPGNRGLNANAAQSCKLKQNRWRRHPPQSEAEAEWSKSVATQNHVHMITEGSNSQHTVRKTLKQALEPVLARMLHRSCEHGLVIVRSRAWHVQRGYLPRHGAQWCTMISQTFHLVAIHPGICSSDQHLRSTHGVFVMKTKEERL